MKKWAIQAGFTIVELLIVVVIISLLASMTVVAYRGIQDRAWLAEAASDISTITKAITLARSNTGQTLAQITGSSGTAYECTHQDGSNSTDENQDLATLPSSHLCWVRYASAMNAISTAAQVNIRNIKDPWGRPYYIDENEGVSGGCSKDTVALFTKPYQQTFITHTTTPELNVPLSGFSGCS